MSMRRSAKLERSYSQDRKVKTSSLAALVFILFCFAIKMTTDQLESLLSCGVFGLILIALKVHTL